ncbi:unnamed protein product [Nezara viridula]|uniref:IBB domain-containing protein n=1 Tax=Nezara viridula TaxID=85310 RepID=A0A9P0HH80_NEZVI|nr:unnamed protein product [Nezara viridula]
MNDIHIFCDIRVIICFKELLFNLTMGDEGADEVLKRVRDNSHAERIKRRKEMYRKQRQLTSELSRIELTKEFSEEEVIKTARMICNGPSDSREQSLMDLKKAFILDQCHMVSFMKVEGALHALVGYLMSKKPVEQLLAAECCSNLAMGDSKTCFKLAKSASPYLITILQGLNYNLMNVCIISLFNLSGSGEKICDLLYSQGIFNALLRTMSIPELRDNTIKTLISFTKTGSKILVEADVKNLLNAVLPYFEMMDKVQWLVYQLTPFSYVNPFLLQNDVHSRILTLLSSHRQIRIDNILAVTSLVRIMGNLIPDPEGITACMLLRRWETTCEVFKFFLTLNFPHLGKEIHWVLANIVHHRNPRVQTQLVGVDVSWAILGIASPGS